MWGGALGAAARERDQDSRSIIVAIFIEKKSFFDRQQGIDTLFSRVKRGDHFLCFIPSIQWDMFFGWKAFLRVP